MAGARWPDPALQAGQTPVATQNIRHGAALIQDPPVGIRQSGSASWDPPAGICQSGCASRDPQSQEATESGSALTQRGGGPERRDPERRLGIWSAVEESESFDRQVINLERIR